jgi:pSer/pThr/pTyr-binding forkhead associated (FHA) protein
MNVEGAQFCENCGSSLGSAASAAPVSFPHPIPPPPMPVNVGVITGRFVVQSSNTQLNFPQGKGEISIGREDPVSNVFPDINLDPYGGFDAGVSRMHAKLILQNGRLVLMDLNAANGTFVNKQKLAPNSHHPVNNGDELRFGQLSILYYSS